jgi:hypothetical protein
VFTKKKQNIKRKKNPGKKEEEEKQIKQTNK